MELQNQFADLDTSTKLKELGFNEPCLKYYLDTHVNRSAKNYTGQWNGNGLKTSIPLWSQVKEWLWQKHKIFVTSFKWASDKLGWDYSIVDKNEDVPPYMAKEDHHLDSPILAEVEGIKKAIEYLHSQLHNIS